MPTWKDTGALATISGGTGFTTHPEGSLLVGTGETGPNGLALLAPAWLPYTPTWTNLTLGNGTVTAKYRKVCGITVVEIVLTFGGTTSITAAAVRASLPANNTNLSSGQVLGTIAMFDSSGTAVYQGLAMVFDQDEAVCYAAGVPMALISATVPFTWAVGDQLCFNLSYQTP